ncbi:hypothetical protein PtrSN002B_007021 [Pyrenophora tritici-repentis]|uniref:Uncharacterized protein n=1 Tax=Pyrenophora tritici-repentis TaxID=45151 RepID=A0A2W1E3V7_9PLEO|nr:hypothetical protein PtrV1_10523 [Pyrenophora tritici-repentis]KAF7446507.1 hypothetical protein A1F99_097980 [Pyrenophora tritici-repentis]KAF7567624.1 hypothetical protein PtrM4_142150 [Pyrenophora tritici-repentis]KAG9382202.1 hypothetical protein A1F94_007856 [Pyrenophora tritici-repentis]KAI0575063.1 hypothetical protein Alg215_08244 [Pyrenophora tritici-repentis]
MRTGIVIRKALRDYSPCPSPPFQAEVDEWRSGRNVEEINSRKVRFFPGIGHKFPGIQKFKVTASQLIKKKDPKMKDIMIEFSRSLT